MTQKRLEEFLGVPQSGSEFGHQVRSALTGPFPWPAGTVSWSLGGRGTDLEPLGHADLLVAPTRGLLIEGRERALAAQKAEQGVA